MLVKSVVTRREIRSLSDSEKKRFFDAVDTMMKNENGPGTSEYYRLASYHGMPPPIYCEHQRETFPGWHRVYLHDFEQTLQRADIKNGNDGNISLPYWYTTIYTYTHSNTSIYTETYNTTKGIGQVILKMVYLK